MTAHKLTFETRSKPGEAPENTVVTAPVALQLLRITGKPEQNQFVEHLSFDGLVFQETDWRYPGEDGVPITGVKNSHEENPINRGPATASACQASCDVPGAIRLEGARYCEFINCTLRNIGWYGLELADGCLATKITGNILTDLGAGGIKVNGVDSTEMRCRQTGRNRITDNRVCRAGRVFHSAVGILLMHSFANRVAHNHIHDILYSGISCGWDWTYGETVSRDNILEKNYIHDIGNGLLDDIGGIYILAGC